jgi:EmrB/QacA subfamily drug resistance transporter
LQPEELSDIVGYFSETHMAQKFDGIAIDDYADVRVRWRETLLTLGFGAFLTSFDAGAITAVLPLIRDAFGTSISSVRWVMTADLLIATGLLLTFGRVGDRIGHRPVFIRGCWIFLLGCVLCGSAQTLSLLIVFRAIQGVGSAMLLASSPAALVKHVPERSRGQALGAKASCIYVGLVAGPALGGWLASARGWRAAFWIEVPAIVVVLALATYFIPIERAVPRTAPYDFAGSILWSAGIASFAWLLGRNRLQLPILLQIFRTPELVTILFIAWAMALVAVERRHPAPLLDFKYFRRRSFSLSVVSLLACFASSYILTFVLPFYLIESRHEGPYVAGEVLALYGLSRSAVACVSGRWSDRLDCRLLTVPGMLIFAAVLTFLSRRAAMLSIQQLAIAVVIAGVGLALFVPANNNALMSSTPPECLGFAAGIMATSRTLGMTAGIALGTTTLDHGKLTPSGPTEAFSMAAMVALAAAVTSSLTKAGRNRIPDRMDDLRKLR